MGDYEKQLEQLELLDINTILRMVPVSRRTIYKMITQNEFPKPCKIGNRAAWKMVEIRKWFDNLKVGEFKGAS